MKKLICVLLAVMMIMTMTACTGPLSEEIVGEWKGYVYLGDMLASYMGDVDDFKSEVGLPVVWTFDDDGECTMEALGGDEGDEAVAALEEELVAYFTEMMYEMADEEQGMDRDEADEWCEDEFGMSIAEYAEEIVKEMDIESIYEAIESEGEYDTDDEDMIIELDGEEMEVELSGNTLTIVDADNDDELEMLFGDLPIELKRIK